MKARTIVAAILLAGASPVWANEKPNIVLFFVDDLGWNNLGYRNPGLFETPNIDTLAKDGLDFRQCYIASPTCSPSRSTLVTGKHPARLKMVRHIPGGPKHPDFDEFGRTEAPGSYHTGAVGHLAVGQCGSIFNDQHPFAFDLLWIGR